MGGCSFPQKSLVPMESTAPRLPAVVAQVDQLLRREELPIFARNSSGEGNREHLLHHSLLSELPADLKSQALALGAGDQPANRAAGALLGTAVGDAVGAVLEFQDVVDFGTGESQPSSWRCARGDCPALAFEGSAAWVRGDAGSCPYCGTARAPDAEVSTGSGYDVSSGSYRGRTTNQFRLKPGQWTDDTSMALCLADSLLSRGGLDGSDLRQRFYAWCFGAYNTPFAADERRTFQPGMPEKPTELEDMWFFDRGSVGCGTNMSRNLETLADSSVGTRPAPVFESADGAEDAGNAPLIRLAAVPVFFHARPREELLAAARASSYSTHPGAVAAESSAFLAFAIGQALQAGPGEGGIAAFLERVATAYLELLQGSAAGDDGRGQEARQSLRRLLLAPAEEPPAESPDWSSAELAWRWRCKRTFWRTTLKNRGQRYNGYPVSSGYVGSFAIDGLAMALWSAYHTTSFDEAIERCVNLQGDADSTAAICGALCGAYYGLRGIGPRLVADVQRWDGGGGIALRGVLLWHLGAVYDGKPPAPLPPLVSS